MDHLYHGYVSHNHRVYKTLQPMTWTYLCDNHAEWWSLWSLTVPFVRPGPILIHTEECSSLWFYRMDCFTCEPLPKQAHIFSEIYTEIYVRCDRLPSSSSCWELLHILQLPGRFPQGVCLTPNLPQVSEAAWSRRNRNHPKQLKTPQQDLKHVLKQDFWKKRRDQWPKWHTSALAISSCTWAIFDSNSSWALQG